MDNTFCDIDKNTCGRLSLQIKFSENSLRTPFCSLRHYHRSSALAVIILHFSRGIMQFSDFGCSGMAVEHAMLINPSRCQQRAGAPVQLEILESEVVCQLQLFSPPAIPLLRLTVSASSAARLGETFSLPGSRMRRHIACGPPIRRRSVE